MIGGQSKPQMREGASDAPLGRGASMNTTVASRPGSSRFRTLRMVPRSSQRGTADNGVTRPDTEGEMRDAKESRAANHGIHGEAAAIPGDAVQVLIANARTGRTCPDFFPYCGPQVS